MIAMRLRIEGERVRVFLKLCSRFSVPGPKKNLELDSELLQYSKQINALPMGCVIYGTVRAVHLEVRKAPDSAMSSWKYEPCSCWGRLLVLRLSKLVRCFPGANGRHQLMLDACNRKAACTRPSRHSALTPHSF